MLQLGGTKCRFLVCLGICIFIGSAIYLKTKVSNSPAPQHSLGTGRSLSAEHDCQTLPLGCTRLLGGREASGWERRTCGVESYLTDPNLSCPRLARDLHFITSPLSREEEEYPLAFIITVHKDLEMFGRLLRAVYAPQNLYCIHVDGKAQPQYRRTVQRLASCFPNVFLASASENVTYAGFSRLQADINCMRDLAKSPQHWRKVLNLCGQDFPIMSNLELVRSMQSQQWRDRNMTPGVKQPPHMRYRTQQQYKEVNGSDTMLKGRGHAHAKGPPPHNMQIYFGTAYYALTRPFVDFVLESREARDLLEWSRDTYSPDEHYWVTLNHLPDAPGSRVNGGWEGGIRAIKWQDQEGRAHAGCKGQYVRSICVYGLEDLHWIINRTDLFANKFASAAFPEAARCMELWHRQKVLRQAQVPIKPEWTLTVEAHEGTRHARHGFSEAQGHPRPRTTRRRFSD